MCEDVPTLLEHAEVLVVGNDDEQARQALSAPRADRIVIDLTRGLARRA